MGYSEDKYSLMHVILSGLAGVEDLKIIFSNMLTYYHKYQRVTYSEVLKSLHEFKKEEESAQIFAYIKFRLEMLVDDDYFQMCIEKYDGIVSQESMSWKDFKRFILKIQDYVELEIIRFESALVESNKSYNKFEEKLKEFDKFLKEQTTKIDGYSRDIESRINSGVTTILGIFAAFIIATFGGISIYGNALSSIEVASVLQVVLMTFLFGMILFNVCFMLIYSVAKISDRNIGVAIDIKDRDIRYESPAYVVEKFGHHNENVTDKQKYQVYFRTIWKNMRRFVNRKYYVFRDGFMRFPLLFVFNFIMILGMIITIQFIYRTGFIYNLLISHDLMHRVLNGQLFY